MKTPRRRIGQWSRNGILLGTIISPSFGMQVSVGDPAKPAQIATGNQSDTEVGSLDKRIQALHPGETLELPAGDYDGPIVIRTPDVTIRGLPGAHISGHGHGSVIVVAADGVTIEGLAITDSGSFYDHVDAAITVHNVRRVSLRDNHIRECLFGIDVGNAWDITIEGNDIRSKALSLGLRGDAVRLWAVRDAHVRRNHWSDTRDAVSWYSERVSFEENTATRSRYSIHSMYSKSLYIRKNRFDGNSVGIFIMYGEGTTILDNLVRGSVGTTGLGLGMKETSSLYAHGNSFIYCATGILVDNSPWEPSTRDWFQNNYIAYNGTGVLFSNGREGNSFESNVFESNGLDVDTSSRQPSHSLWRGNTWDNYDGFDHDRNGIGDTPYRVYKYDDLLSDAHPSTRFFYATPIVSLLALVEKLLPFSEPVELLADPLPRMPGGKPVATAGGTKK
jgi:nitrous oxidase accessory protein